ncbi:hypothetical protein C8F01DRAFT_1173515 [Mycena amicta]|nr:hypothetical protein C8F01DRAFT_1173515 [Mycena amicta]
MSLEELSGFLSFETVVAMLYDGARTIIPLLNPMEDISFQFPTLLGIDSNQNVCEIMHFPTSYNLEPDIFNWYYRSSNRPIAYPVGQRVSDKWTSQVLQAGNNGDCAKPRSFFVDATTGGFTIPSLRNSYYWSRDSAGLQQLCLEEMDLYTPPEILFTPYLHGICLSVDELNNLRAAFPSHLTDPTTSYLAPIVQESPRLLFNSAKARIPEPFGWSIEPYVCRCCAYLDRYFD